MPCWQRSLTISLAKAMLAWIQCSWTWSFNSSLCSADGVGEVAFSLVILMKSLATSSLHVTWTVFKFMWPAKGFTVFPCHLACVAEEHSCAESKFNCLSISVNLLCLAEWEKPVSNPNKLLSVNVTKPPIHSNQIWKIHIMLCPVELKKVPRALEMCFHASFQIPCYAFGQTM